jgi:hypothetical protein
LRAERDFIPTALISDRRAPIRGDLLDDVGTGRLTLDEAQTISSIVAKRAELFPSIELPVKIEAIRRSSPVLLCVHAAISDPPPVRDRLTIAQDGPGWMSLEPRVGRYSPGGMMGESAVAQF